MWGMGWARHVMLPTVPHIRGFGSSSARRILARLDRSSCSALLHESSIWRPFTHHLFYSSALLQPWSAHRHVHGVVACVVFLGRFHPATAAYRFVCSYSTAASPVCPSSLLSCPVLTAPASATLKFACPKGVYVAPNPDEPLQWSGILFLRKGEHDPVTTLPRPCVPV